MVSKSIIISRNLTDGYRVWIPKNLLKDTREFWAGSWLVKTDSLVCVEKITLDKLSIWGGPDKTDEETISWEFPCDLKLVAIYYIIDKLFPKATIEIYKLG